MRKYLLILLSLSFLAATCGEKPKEETPSAPAAPTGVKLHSSTETSLSFQWNVT